jgi:hypothetical protein
MMPVKKSLVVVRQCQNGHTACGGCCKKLTRGLCPSCSLPIGANRCIVVEKIIESLQVHCKYAAFGCKNMMQYAKHKRHEHEVTCKFRPYQCPVLGCSLEVPKSGVSDHFRSIHDGETVYYENPDDDDPPDEMKNSFTVSTDDVAYDRSHSQYVIVLVSKDLDSELDQDSGDPDSEELEEELFLVHHQFHERHCRYSFSLTSFGACFSDYRLSVNCDRAGRSARRAFKGNHTIEGPVYDNQRDKALLGKIVRQGDCLFVPMLSASQKDSSKFEVEFQIADGTRR